MKKRVIILGTLGIAALAAILAFYFLAYNGIGLGCIFFQLTGLQCPGCGNSRAIIALFKLDLSKVLSYNLLFPLEVGYLIWVILCSCYAFLRTGSFLYKPQKWWIDATILVIVIAWGVIRNIL